MVCAYRWEERHRLWRWSVHRGAVDGPVLRKGIALELDDAIRQAQGSAADDTRRISRRPNVAIDSTDPEG